ncbi:MAG TPA: hypothetical protein VMI12_09990 [Puia sp.]|nr:hypothetical protein [Puia sp.]
MLFYYLDWRFSRNSIYLVMLIVLMWLISFRHGFYWRYNFLSLYYYIPFVVLVLAVPAPNESHLQKFMKAVTIVAAINDIAGIIQYILNPGDDNFVGIYGRFTVSQNGLALINSVLFFYYFILYGKTKKIAHILLASFFIVCSVMGFYGAGMMVLLATLMIFYFKFTLKNILKFIFFLSLIGVSVYFLMKMISPKTLEYNINIIQKFLVFDPQRSPRKMVIFYNYAKEYFAHPLDFLFGSGPGTFNSRSAFMVGSPSYFNAPILKSDHHPFYFINFAYTLWNPEVVTPYDGFMNQPFTSILALLGEYGFIVTGFLFFLIFYNYRKFNRITNIRIQGRNKPLAGSFIRFLTIFMVLLIIIDNYIEYPETIALFIVLIKLCESSLKANLAQSESV